MEEIHEKEIEEPRRWGPIKYVVMVFLVFLIVVMAIPYYSIKLNPEPKYIPTIEEVVPKDFEVNITNIDRTNYLNFINPADPVVKQTADKIVSLSGCGSNKICQAKAIYYFIQNNFDYVSDPLKFEYIKTARESLKSGISGDCDDAAVLASNALQAIGIKTRFVFVPSHVYIQAYLPDAPRTLQRDGWVNLDLTCEYCKFGEVAYRYKDSDKRFL